MCSAEGPKRRRRPSKQRAYFDVMSRHKDKAPINSKVVYHLLKAIRVSTKSRSVFTKMGFPTRLKVAKPKRKNVADSTIQS